MGPPAGAARAATGTAGLSSGQAARRLAEMGPNVVPERRRVTWWQRLGLQLRDPLMVVLLVAAALTVATGDHPDAVIIAIVIIANTTVGLVQETKADNAIAALRELTAPMARVVRDGVMTAVDAAALVPEDVILVGEGDVVPADATLTETAALRVDESAMTGESVPVDKAPGISADQAELLAGTVVVHGRGVAVVTRTGAQSAMGVIAAVWRQRPP